MFPRARDRRDLAVGPDLKYAVIVFVGDIDIACRILRDSERPSQRCRCRERPGTNRVLPATVEMLND
jgi:hypothetical protein